MVLVNGNWELIYDLHDISKIIRENYNVDLADEMDKLLPEHTYEEYKELERDLSISEDMVIQLEKAIEELECRIEELEEKIEELEEPEGE